MYSTVRCPQRHAFVSRDPSLRRAHETDRHQVLINVAGLRSPILTVVGRVQDRPRCPDSPTLIGIHEIHGLQILRPGVVSKDELKRLSTINILFVCTGNICRSPIAKGLCRKYLAENLDCKVDQLKEMGYKVDSAGVIAIPGLKASSESAVFCAERGVDISAHRSKPLAGDLLQDFDYIYVMSQAHRQHVVGLVPEAAHKIRLLDEDREIPDPIGGGEEAYKRCGVLIEKTLKKRIAELLI